MKTTDPRDPLDQKIDQLLASQPVKAPEDFARRTLAEAEARENAKASRTLAPILSIALPLAAAIVLAFVIYTQLGHDYSDTPVQVTENTSSTSANPEDAEELTHYEIQELLFLQEGLSGFAQVEPDGLSGGDLLETLNTLHSI